MASVMPSGALPALNCMPTEILDLIFAHFSPLDLWHLRRTSKRFNAVLYPHLLSTLRAMADPLPLTLIRETEPVPLSFVYSLVLAVLGYDEGRKLWGRIFPSRDTSPETPYSSWLPATPLHFLLPPSIDQNLSPAAIRRQNDINAHPDLFIPHLRAASPSLANLRRIHFWSILLWYKESSHLSLAQTPALKAGQARKDRLRWAYTQHRYSYWSRPGDDAATVDKLTRTYMLRSHFDRPVPSWLDRDSAFLHMRGGRPWVYDPDPPGLDRWLHGVTAPPDYMVPSRMRRRPGRSEEFKEVIRSIFATRAEFERNG